MCIREDGLINKLKKKKKKKIKGLFSHVLRLENPIEDITGLTYYLSQEFAKGSESLCPVR